MYSTTFQSLIRNIKPEEVFPRHVKSRGLEYIEYSIASNLGLIYFQYKQGKSFINIPPDVVYSKVKFSTPKLKVMFNWMTEKLGRYKMKEIFNRRYVSSSIKYILFEGSGKAIAIVDRNGVNLTIIEDCDMDKKKNSFHSKKVLSIKK